MGDLQRGYSFTDGVVDDCSSAHLHELVESAEIQTSFHTDKASGGADPGKATHEMMLYRNSDDTFRKATLGAAIFDSAEMLANRTAKTIPVGADLLILGDAAAGNAIKKITLANLLFNSAVYSGGTLDGVADRLVVYKGSDGSVRRIALSTLILGAPASAGAVGSDYLLMSSGAGVLKTQSLVGLITQAPGLTAPAGDDLFAVYDLSAATYKSTSLATLISGLASTLSAPVGTELVQVNDAGTLKKMALSAVAGVAQMGYAIAAQKQNVNVPGGSATGSTWVARSINTSVYDPLGLFSQINGFFVLQAGTYRIRARACGYECGIHRIRLQNVTAGTIPVVPGSAVRSTTGTMTEAQLTGRFTVGANEHLTLDHWVSIANNTSDFGKAVNNGTEDEYYCQIEIWKEP